MYVRTFVSVLILVLTLCSSSTADVDSRIVNGTTAADGKYPYQVSLRTVSNDHFCGGSILNEHWILTAAHCLGIVPNVSIVVGTNTLSENGTAYEMFVYMIHKWYNPVKVIYDAGVARVKTVIVFSAKVQSIDIALIVPLNGATVVVTGWGLTDVTENSLPDNLQSLVTYFLARRFCRPMVQDKGLNLHISQICTLRKQAGFCMGDSGGPLVANGKQIGIVSLAYPCAKGVPDVYTNVPWIYAWIKSKTLY